MSDRREEDQIEGVPLPEERRAAIGHDAARERALERLSAGRLAGAYLLHGARGIGKATLSFELARTAFGATGDETEAHAFAQVAAGSYPNLFVLRPGMQERTARFSKFIQVGQVRDMVEQLHQTRGRAGMRVALVDAIDDCNPSAANALLKYLEEPPPDTCFLLVSHRPGSLLPTIRSRCLGLSLRPIADAEVRAVLTADRAELAPAALERAVALAKGRPRRAFEALSLADAGALAALQAWLGDPGRGGPGAHLGLAEALGGSFGDAEGAFARELILDALAEEARRAALGGAAARTRLASANALWDKAAALFADIDEINLDARRSLTVLFDALLQHTARFSPASEPT